MVNLESEINFQRQSFTKYFRFTLVFMRNIAPGESLICIFQEFLDTINEKIIFAGRLGTLLSFYEPYTYSLYFLIAQNTQS